MVGKCRLSVGDIVFGVLVVLNVVNYRFLRQILSPYIMNVMSIFKFCKNMVIIDNYIKYNFSK